MDIFVDSDGVIYNFDKLLKDNNIDNNSSKAVYNFLKVSSDFAFLEGEIIEENLHLLDLVKEGKAKILTSLPNKYDFRNYFEEEKEYLEVYEKLKNNKYSFYEKLGIPRDSVIIVDTRNEKFKYCSSGSILYDDFPKTVDKWNELGGEGHLVKNHLCSAQNN